jgi:ribosomal protein L37AE/L43A
MKQTLINPGASLRKDSTHIEADQFKLVEMQTCPYCNDTPVELEEISKGNFACVHCGGISNSIAFVTVPRGYK